MFEALTSLYMTWDSESCKKESPLAAPTATLILIVQESGSALPIVEGNRALISSRMHKKYDTKIRIKDLVKLFKICSISQDQATSFTW